MRKSLMLTKADDERIENLKKDLGIHKKIDVVRAALTLLENESLRIKKIKRWQQATTMVIKSSQTINKEFQPHSRLKKGFP